MPDAFPRRFGRYVLVDHLARGGMGSLFLAWQGAAGMEKLCVVKTVLRGLADPEYVARFRDEAKVVVRLSHGNLVPVFDAGSVDGELYVAMEYVDGRDLRAVWNRCAERGIAFPLEVAVHVVKELCRGLHHAHSVAGLQLVHRDVSPPNVLLAYSGEVKLTDFGLATSTLKLERTVPGIVYGKVSYMSPEQARGEPLDGRTDLYAAAIILWELLTGRQLFPNSDGTGLQRVRNPQVVPPSQRAARVPPELDELVMHALAPDREQRFPDGEALRAALAGWLARRAPTFDAARVAAFLRELWGGEIDRDRKRREELVAESRRLLGERGTPARADPKPQQRSAATTTDEIEDPSSGIVGALLDGRYRVLRLIGEGGMGRVYEAEHVEIGKRVAVKVLHPSSSRHPEVVERFRREARAASRIGHPNIVDVTDFGTTQHGDVYFVMEFLEGADLATVIDREHTLPVERAVHIAVQLAHALEAAHAAQVIHRDLKPENVFLVDRPGQLDFVKVLDFGIARSVELESGSRLTQPNVAMGTPEYMAPEQAAGKPADARSDVYAVGSIVFEMLVGNSPHRGGTAMEILDKKSREVPPRLTSLRPETPQQLSDMVARALAISPDERPQTMSELAAELERCRPDRRRRNLPAAGAEPVHRRSPRAVVAASVAGAAGLLLLAGAVVLRHGGDRPQAAISAPGEAPSLPAAAETNPAPEAPTASPMAARAPEPATAVVVSHKDRPTTKARPIDGPRVLAEAQRLLGEHRLAPAERAFQQLYSAGVKKPEAATGLAHVSFEAGRYDEAAQRGERAVQLGGGAAAHLVLGDAYFKVRRYQAAVQQYRAVLKLNPNHGAARKRLDAALARAKGG